MFTRQLQEALQQVTIFVPKRFHSPVKDFARNRGISERELYRRLLEPALKKIASGHDPLPEIPDIAA